MSEGTEEKLDIQVESTLLNQPIPPPTDEAASTTMEDILVLLKDPEAPASDISRLIALELGSTINQISLLQEATSGFKLKFLKEQVKALRELSRTLFESETMSKKDVLNFDGPKFAFVFQELTGYFKKALTESGITEDQSNAVLRQFRDIVSQKEVELRKQCDRIESSQKGSLCLK